MPVVPEWNTLATSGMLLLHHGENMIQIRVLNGQTLTACVRGRAGGGEEEGEGEGGGSAGKENGRVRRGGAVYILPEPNRLLFKFRGAYLSFPFIGDDRCD